MNFLIFCQNFISTAHHVSAVFRYFLEMIGFEMILSDIVLEKKMAQSRLFRMAETVALSPVPIKSYSKSGNLPFILEPIIDSL